MGITPTSLTGVTPALSVQLTFARHSIKNLTASVIPASAAYMSGVHPRLSLLFTISALPSFDTGRIVCNMLTSPRLAKSCSFPISPGVLCPNNLDFSHKFECLIGTGQRRLVTNVAAQQVLLKGRLNVFWACTHTSL
eukprot:m.99650 g.99650  ORF g.99650 m.99650 type:complete len:137 (+) comp12469_c0_seq4:4794-5204(+)